MVNVLQATRIFTRKWLHSSISSWFYCPRIRQTLILLNGFGSLSKSNACIQSIIQSLSILRALLFTVCKKIHSQYKQELGSLLTLNFQTFKKSQFVNLWSIYWRVLMKLVLSLRERLLTSKTSITRYRSPWVKINTGKNQAIGYQNWFFEIRVNHRD